MTKSPRRFVIAIVGGTLLVGGTLALVIPGHWFVAFLGLALLAREFPWARRWQEWIASLPGRLRVAMRRSFRRLRHRRIA